MKTVHRGLADFHDTGWRTGLFRALLIAILAASAVVAPVAVLRMVMSWRMVYLLPLAFGAAALGVFDTERLGRPDWRNRRGLVFRLGEIALLLAVAQIVIWSVSAGWPSGAELARWLRHPEGFFSGEWAATGLLLLSAWGLAVLVTGDFLDLAIQPDEVAAQESHGWGDTRSQWRLFRPVSRGEIVGRFTVRWVWGGVILVLLAALSGISAIQDTRSILKFSFSQPDLPPDVAVGLLCYFLSGLLLLSDARLAVLRGRWHNEGVAMAPDVTRRWHMTGTLIVSAVAAAALLLPLGTTGWLGEALEWFIALTARIMMALLLLLSLLVTALLYPLRFLLKPGDDGATALQKWPNLHIPTQIEATQRVPDWLGGALLWGAVVLIGGYLITIYLRSHGRLTGLRGARLVQLRLWWRARRARVSLAIQAHAAVLQRRRGRSRSGQTRTMVHLKQPLDALLLRERVRFLYLQTVNRAAERGLERQGHETPLEFASDLRVNWPDAEPDVQALTDAFVAARYTRREIPAAEVQRVQHAWQRLMETLRRSVGRTIDRDA